MNKRVLVIIPARYDSSRFPGKPLALIAGKPMIEWTYNQAKAATKASAVIVATDDQRIFDCVKDFGGEVMMTRADHPSGTDRIAEVAAQHGCDLVINVQGDEPLISPLIIDQLIDSMFESNADMGTVGVPIKRDKEFEDPNIVKIVMDNRGFALYFSRARVPFLRSGGEELSPIQHWGLYAYTPTLLKAFVNWDEGALEKCEKLEQLRVLENGGRIRVIIANEPSIGVDTPEDIAKVEAIIKKKA